MADFKGNMTAAAASDSAVSTAGDWTGSSLFTSSCEKNRTKNGVPLKMSLLIVFISSCTDAITKVAHERTVYCREERQ